MAHELVHWEHGDQACTPMLETKAECRTAYADAETLCEGHAAGIAEELEVTRQVLDDYRQILHDTIPA